MSIFSNILKPKNPYYQPLTLIDDEGNDSQEKMILVIEKVYRIALRNSSITALSIEPQIIEEYENALPSYERENLLKSNPLTRDSIIIHIAERYGMYPMNQLHDELYAHVSFCFLRDLAKSMKIAYVNGFIPKHLLISRTTENWLAALFKEKSIHFIATLEKIKHAEDEVVADFFRNKNIYKIQGIYTLFRLLGAQHQKSYEWKESLHQNLDHPLNQELHYAATLGHVDAVELFILRGADPHSLNREGKSVLEVAQENNMSSVIKKINELTSHYYEE